MAFIEFTYKKPCVFDRVGAGALVFAIPNFRNLTPSSTELHLLNSARRRLVQRVPAKVIFLYVHIYFIFSSHFQIYFTFLSSGLVGEGRGRGLRRDTKHENAKEGLVHNSYVRTGPWPQAAAGGHAYVYASVWPPTAAQGLGPGPYV